MRKLVTTVLALSLGLLAAMTTGYGAKAVRTAASTGGASTFSAGELAAAPTGVAALTAAGCGFNSDGEPSVHVSRAGQIFVGSERGLGGASDAWVRSTLLDPPRAATPGGPGTSACDLHYDGQPNGIGGAGASGGDIDTAFGSSVLPGTPRYPMYVASLNLGSVSVSRSLDNGTTWQTTPVQGGLPGDDREWIAAYGATTSLLSFHDIASGQIDVLRSDDAGAAYTQIGTAIPLTGPYGYAANDNEIGNIAIDRINPPSGALPSPAGFRAYQAFVAPSTAPPVSANNLGCADPALLVCADQNEAFVSVSNNGGIAWTPRPIPCSVAGTALNHQFPNVSVAPNGNLWETWSDGSSIHAGLSTDQGASWSCSKVSSGGKSLMPWIVAASGGEDLVYYGQSGSTWYVYLAQNTSTTAAGTWTTTQLMPVHSGAVCEQGFSCTTGRQLFDDFGVDTDPAGYAHIAYSHDCTTATVDAVLVTCASPAGQIGGSGTYTGYAVQTGGTTIGAPN